MERMGKRRLLVVLLLVGSDLAHAQGGGEADSLRTYVMEPVVVTGSRVEVARSSVPLTVTTVSGSTIVQSREMNLLPVLSRRVPGLFITERGMMGYGIAGGSAGQIRIRGVGGSPTTGVLVLVDGHPQFMGIFGHPFPDAYVSSDAERVEVIRGPASVLYGTGALGGVINILTSRTAPGRLRATASAAMGSFDTQHYSGHAGIRRNGRELFVSLNHDRTGGHRVGDDFWLTNAYAKLGSAIARGWRATLDGRLSSFRTEDPGPVTDPAVDEERWADVLRNRVSISLENAYVRTEGALKLFYNHGDHEIYDGFRSEDFNGGALAYQAIRLSGASLVTLGAELKRYGGASRNVTANADFGSHAITEIGGYSLLQHAFSPRLLVHAGARLENHSEFGVEAAPQLGLAWQVASGTTLKGAVARGYRSPTVLELFLFPPANPGLQPETMWNYEAGVERTGNHYHAELVGFVTEGSNLIRVEGTFPNVRRENAGSFSHRGLEFQTTYAPAKRLTLHANAAYLDMQGAPVPGAPEWHGFAEAAYTARAWHAALEFETISGLSLGGDPPTSEAYSLLHFRAGVKPVAPVQLFIRAENLSDTSYQINPGYPMPGRSVIVGARATY